MTRCPDDCQYGDCNNQYPFQCICYDSALKGHWGGSDHGGPCNECRAGYYGPRCTFVCPGGTCQTCGGHGICNDGRNGNGQCQCFAESQRGFWGGQGCTRCADLHYGSECKGVCGCSSHGTCEQGIAGNGTCFCDYGWEGVACGDCDQKIIPGCKSVLKCPGDPLPCSGNGNCTRPTAGSLIGVCTCNEFFGKADCSQECPGHCSGHGLCQDGADRDGSCLCEHGFALPGCATCLPDRWGPRCQALCPRSAGGAVCNSSGTCRASDGRCDCNQVYSGPGCLTPCPTINGFVCNGHGVCDADALCSCTRDATRGFWEGTLCTTCASGYAGPECTIACPRYDDKICSGNGVCLASNGTCDCVPPYCGAACVVKFNTTTGRCQSCPEQGQYGANCTGVCQCVHGACDDGRAGDGSCTCDAGWAGALCDTECPGGVAAPCGGPLRGRCVPSRSECDCNAGYAGAACELQCPDPTCHGHGACSDGHTGDGTCACQVGWVWPATGCNQRCDCSGHGTCPPGNLTCDCHLGFTGAMCDRCVDGLGGGACNATCAHGITEGYHCKCDDGWGGAACDVGCPLQDGKVCNGQGTCGASGECSCTGGWVGPKCECHDTACENRIGPAVCNATSGQCQCAPGRAGLAVACQECVVGLWGPDCTDVCDCSRRGSCNKLTGACSCFGNDDIGHWAGANCDTCATGYMGATCRQRSIAVTVLTSLLTRTQTVQRNFFCHLDAGREILYCGGQGATAVFNVSTTIPKVLGMSTVQAACGNGGGDLFAVFPSTAVPAADSGSGSASNASHSGESTAATRAAIVGRRVEREAAPDGSSNSALSTAPSSSGRVSSPQSDRSKSGRGESSSSQQSAESSRAVLIPSSEATGAPTSSPPSSSSTSAASSASVASAASSALSSNASGAHASHAAPTSASAQSGSESNASSIAGPGPSGGSADSERDSSSSAGGPAAPGPSPGAEAGGIYTGPSRYPYEYLYLMQLNTTCTTTNVQLWRGGAQYFFEDREVVIRNVIDSTPQYIDHAEFVALYGTVCVIPSKAREVYCKTPTSPIAQVGLLDIVRATSMRQLKVEGALIISGTYKSQCQIIKVNGSTAQAFAADAQPMAIKTDMQRLGIKCQSVDCTYLDEASRQLYFAASSPTGSYVGSYHIDTGVLTEGGMFMASSERKCAAIVHDPESLMGLVIFGDTMIKFRPDTANGTVVFRAYGQQALASPLVRDLVLFRERQVVYGPLLSTRGTSVFRFLLVEVESVAPVVADRAGGAVVTLRGSGFRNSSSTVCRFGDSDVVPAVFVSPTVLHCVAPLAQSGDTCLLQTVEVSSDGLAFTANRNTVDRPVAAVVSRIEPRRAALSAVVSGALGVVEVHGTGFIQSDSARCKLVVDPSLPASDPRREVFLPYTYKLPTLVECRLPSHFPAPTEPSSVVAVSLDGQVFGAVTAPFSVVGDATALTAAPPVITRGSAPTVTFVDPAVAVRAVDAKGNLVGEFDTDGRALQITAGGGVGAGGAELNGTLAYTMAGGEASLDGMFMRSPNVATLRFYVDAVADGWRTDFTIVITSGALFALRMVQSPIPAAGTLVPNALLPQVADVATIDAAGNVVGVKAGEPPVVVNVTLWQVDPDASSGGAAVAVANTTSLFAELSVKDTGQATLDQLPLPLVFGPRYRMSFVVATDASIAISTRTFEAGCAAGQFYVTGEASCRECDPSQAHCNGTDAVILKPGFWRASAASLTIYKCPTEDACTGNAPFGGCELGYRGPMCDVCAEDWGKDFTNTCAECPALFVSALTAIVLLCVYVAIATALLVVIVQNWEAPMSRVVDSVVILTMAFSFLQNVSLTQFYHYPWVPFNQQLFSGLGTAADLRFASVRPVYCLFRAMGLTDQHLPALYAALFALIPIVQAIARGLFLFFPDLGRSEEALHRRRELLASMRQLRAQGHTELGLSDETPVEHDMKPTLLVSAQLIVFFLLQPGLFYALETLFCKEIAVGGGASLSVLRNDFAVSCSTGQYDTVRIVCIILLLLYLMVPAAAWMVVLLFQSKHKDTFYRLYAAFITVGLRDEVWYWHIAGLGKKIVMVFAVVVPSEPVDMYLFCWATMLFTFLAFYLDPYVERKHNRIELGLNFCTMLTANAALAIRVLDIDAVVDTMSALVLVMNCGTYLYLAYDLGSVWLVTSYKRFMHSRRLFDDADAADADDGHGDEAVGVDPSAAKARRRGSNAAAALRDTASRARSLLTRAFKAGRADQEDPGVVSSALEDEEMAAHDSLESTVDDPFAAIAPLDVSTRRVVHDPRRAPPSHNARGIATSPPLALDPLATPPFSPGLTTPGGETSGVLSPPSELLDAALLALDSPASSAPRPDASMARSPFDDLDILSGTASTKSNDPLPGDHQGPGEAQPRSAEFMRMQRDIERFFTKGVARDATVMKEASRAEHATAPKRREGPTRRPTADNLSISGRGATASPAPVSHSPRSRAASVPVIMGATGALDGGAGHIGTSDPWGAEGGSDQASTPDLASPAHPNNRQFPARRGELDIDDGFDFDIVGDSVSGVLSPSGDPLPPPQHQGFTPRHSVVAVDAGPEADVAERQADFDAEWAEALADEQREAQRQRRVHGVLPMPRRAPARPAIVHERLRAAVGGSTADSPLNQTLSQQTSGDFMCASPALGDSPLSVRLPASLSFRAKRKIPKGETLYDDL